MATFTAIVTAHADKDNIVRTLDHLLNVQTRPPEEIIALASDIEVDDISDQFPSVIMCVEPNRNDWGHEKRATGLDMANCEYVGWFNHDDSYSPTYIEEMVGEADRGADVVYCGWSKLQRPTFSLNSSTSGNYIVNTALAREAGYTDRHYEADGTFINRIAGVAKSIKFLDKVLYFHNEVK